MNHNPETYQEGTKTMQTSVAELISKITKVGIHASACVAMAVNAVLCFVMVNAAGAAPAINVQGTSWAGVEVFKGSLQRVGAVKYSGFASLEIDSAGQFVYTDSDGFEFSGAVVQTGRKLKLSYDASAIASMEAQLAAIIVNELNSDGIDPGVVSVAIAPDSVRATGKLRSKKAGHAIVFTSSMRFIANSSTVGTRKGKSLIKGVLALSSGE